MVLDGIKLEGDVEAEGDLWKGKNFDEYIKSLERRISMYGFTVEVVPGLTKDNYKLLMVGDREHSRLIAVQSHFPRGVIGLVPDDGLPPTFDRGYRPWQYVTFLHLAGEGCASFRKKLEIDYHPNCRLIPKRLAPPTAEEKRQPN